jgi:hypothetical protein
VTSQRRLSGIRRRAAGCVAAVVLAGAAAWAGASAAASSGANPVAGSPDRAAGLSQTGATTSARTRAGTQPGARTASSRSWTLKIAIHYLPPSTNRSEFDVALQVKSAVWFFGGSNEGGTGISYPKAERVMHGVPRSFKLPSGPYSWIEAAAAASPRAIWAVTYLGGSVMHWNGSTWQTLPSGGWQSGTRFTGIAVASRTDIWAFGTAGAGYRGAGAWRFDGTRWFSEGGLADGIYQAAAAGPSDIWGIGGTKGGMGSLLRYNGRHWRRVRPRTLAGMRYSRIEMISRDDVWVAGTVAGAPELGHYNGRAWTAISMPGTVPATWLCRDGRGGMWVVANSGASPSVLLHRSASGAWSKSTVSLNGADQVLACQLIPSKGGDWGAGVTAAPHGTAAAIYRYG